MTGKTAREDKKLHCSIAAAACVLTEEEMYSKFRLLSHIACILYKRSSAPGSLSFNEFASGVHSSAQAMFSGCVRTSVCGSADRKVSHALPSNVLSIL